MKKSLYIICAIVLVAIKLSAQDEGIFNHYVINPVLVNPSFTGKDNKYQLFGHYRTQWTGFPNAAKTYALSYNGPLSDKVALGGMILSEKYGLTDRLRGQMSYAYHFTNDKKGFKGGFGFSTEFHRTRLDPSVLTSNFFETGDRTVLGNVQNVSIFDATAGFYGVFSDKLTLHLALPNLIRTRIGGQTPDSVKTEKTFLRQFLLGASYRVKMGEKIVLEPSAQIRRVYQSPFEVELNMLAHFMNDRFTTGISLRPGTSGAASLLFGVKEKSFSIYYTYSASMAEITSNRQGHEVTLGIELNRTKKEKIQAPTEKTKKKYRN